MKKLYMSSKEVKAIKLDDPIQNSDFNADNDIPVKTLSKTKSPNKLLSWFSSRPTIVKWLMFFGLVGIICSIALVTYYIMLINEGEKEPIQIKNTLVTATVQKNYYSYLYSSLTHPSLPRDAENPINGELYTQDEMKEIKKNPPLAVMIENHTAARPQSGLDKADIVFEMLAEGGITRFMGIFWGKAAKEIGPIRSARQYYVETLSPYDAIYMHIGGATTNDPKTNALGNIYVYGIHSLDTGGSFYRSKDRKAPHNAYSTTETLWNIAKKRGWTDYTEPKPWKFKRDAKMAERGENTVADIRFLKGIANGGAYDVTWTYNKKTNLYYRNNGGLAHTDKVTGQQYTGKNIVIQEVKFYFTLDGKGHVVHEVIGSGNGKLLRDGKVIPITWSKPDRKSLTIYKDSSGKEIEFNRGQIWVEVVSKTDAVIKIIE